jgi:hypothetical protein
MPSIVDYPIVLEQMQAAGMRCLYYNSGAFGPADASAMKAIGWIGPDDPSIRPEARALTRAVPPPYERTLANTAMRAWRDLLPGKLWIMPRSHWAYELDFGSKVWMPASLQSIGIDPGALAPRTNGAAIEFELVEANAARDFVEALLTHLLGSDFALAWPGRPVVCTVHHHKQLWWVTADAELLARVNESLENEASRMA